MNTFQLKIDTERNQGLKYQIYTKELIQDPEIQFCPTCKNKVVRSPLDVRIL